MVKCEIIQINREEKFIRKSLTKVFPQHYYGLQNVSSHYFTE